MYVSYELRAAYIRAIKDSVGFMFLKMFKQCVRSKGK